MKYRPVLGIEIHVQLNTHTKLFCSCINEYSPEEPNKNICPFCTGQPGALPVLNKAAVQKAIQFGLALNSTIPNKTRWDRKNYFYPDLPAGYQISQFDNPIVEGGQLTFWVEEDSKEPYQMTINLTRAHLEADAAKLLHVGSKSMVDFNRSGCPLIEIVTEPEFHSDVEVIAFVQELQLLVRRIGISHADMEKGQMRFDCNISLQNEEEQKTNSLPKYRVELKNINSPRAMGRAIASEIIRQTELLEQGVLPAQETRGWRDDLNSSISQRSKENSDDYRYIPEPDMRTLLITQEDIASLADLAELPQVQRKRYMDLGLHLQTADVFVNQQEAGNMFDSTLSILAQK